MIKLTVLLLMATCYLNDAQKEYLIYNKMIRNTQISLENVSVSISNSTFIKVDLILTGNGTTTFIMENCTLMGSMITLQYVEYSKIEFCQFIAEKVPDGEESPYMLTIVDSINVSLQYALFTGSESAWKKGVSESDLGSNIWNVTVANTVSEINTGQVSTPPVL